MADLSSEAYLRQYERLADDVRHYDDLYWQVPSAGTLVFTGVVAAAYQFLDSVARVFLLVLGAALAVSLTIALAKHRFFMEVRVRFLQELEEGVFGIPVFPATIEEGIEYLDRSGSEKRPGSRDPVLIVLRRRRAAIWLLYVMLIASVGLASVAVREGLRAAGWVP